MRRSRRRRRPISPLGQMSFIIGRITMIPPPCRARCRLSEIVFVGGGGGGGGQSGAAPVRSGPVGRILWNSTYFLFCYSLILLSSFIIVITIIIMLFKPRVCVTHCRTVYYNIIILGRMIHTGPMPLCVRLYTYMILLYYVYIIVAVYLPNARAPVMPIQHYNVS